MKKKWFITCFVLITSFSGITQLNLSTHKRVNFIGISDYDTLTYNFYKCMYDSIREVNSNKFYINFQFGEALLFKIKHGYINPNHGHIYSSKTNDIYTFAAEVLNDIAQSQVWVLGNYNLLYEADFRFFNSVYPNLFTNDFIKSVKEWRYDWRYDNNKFIELDSLDSMRMFNYLDEHVTDAWDRFVLKNAISRVSKSSRSANSYRAKTLEDSYLFPSYNFLTGYFSYLHVKKDTLKVDVVLNTPYSPAFFDGYSFKKKKKNKHYLKGLTGGFHKIENQSIGVFDMRKFKKVIRVERTYIFNW